MKISEVDESNLTPGMRQFLKVKQENPDCIILFRMGDFYETFYEDAITCAKELEITLTARGKGEKRAPLAGIPFHALDTYLPRLIKKGYRVAIVEQIEDPKLAKGLVKRDVVRIVSPGTVIDTNVLDAKSNNYIMAIVEENGKYGIAISDVSTGEFIGMKITDKGKLVNELSSVSPAEVLLPETYRGKKELIEMIKNTTDDIFVNFFSDHSFMFKNSYKSLITHFNTMSLDGFGIENEAAIISAAGGLFTYLVSSQKIDLKQITSIKRVMTEDFMVLDRSTLRNLELMRNIADGSTRGTLLDAIDMTVTPMGARLLKMWLLRPLLSANLIAKRQDAVEELVKNSLMRDELRAILSDIYDLERLLSKISYGTAMPRDLIALKKSLALIPKIKELFSNVGVDELSKNSELSELKEIVELIEKAINEEAPNSIRQGNIINKGYHEQLDQIRSIAFGGKDWIADQENKERERTGIKSLRISFNKVFGYYIDVRNTYKHKVPSDYIRKQTCTNSERYITQELKEKEEMILGAEEKINTLEFDLYMNVLKEIEKFTVQIQDIASKLAKLDCYSSFADTAAQKRYIRAIVDESDAMEIVEGRHPVVEKVISEPFIPNDCVFDDKHRMSIITGPNMSGKSTFMRMIAIIQLLSQIGSFVPAKSAHVGICDRIFTRVGAYDDLTMGQSTFMVEMNETANILNNATQKSLVVLDEIGRGTSTYDGVSIAWSVAEYLYSFIGAKTLFATHYHILNRMAEQHSGIKNFNIAVTEKGGEVIFLRKILEGGTDRSYGIEVAKLAGLPSQVIDNARVIMGRLEQEDDVGEMVHNSVNGQKAVAEKTTAQKKVTKQKKEEITDSSLSKFF